MGGPSSHRYQSDRQGEKSALYSTFPPKELLPDDVGLRGVAPVNVDPRVKRRSCVTLVRGRRRRKGQGGVPALSGRCQAAIYRMQFFSSRRPERAGVPAPVAEP